MIEARLSKDRRYIVCGRPLPGGHRCGQRLAYVDWWPGYEDGAPHIVMATLPSGFVLDEARQIWHLSNHARRRWERDRAAAAQGDRAAAERLRTGQTLRGRRSRLVDARWVMLILAYPDPDEAAQHDAEVLRLRDAERQAGIQPGALGPEFMTIAEAWEIARERGIDGWLQEMRGLLHGRKTKERPVGYDGYLRRYAWTAQRDRAIVCPACQALNRLATIADSAGFLP